jgi:hypothetical protein
MNDFGSNKTLNLLPTGTHERHEKEFQVGNESLSLFPGSIRKPAFAEDNVRFSLASVTHLLEPVTYLSD